MRIFESSILFDSLHFDCAQNVYKINDIEKAIDTNNIKNVHIKNWSKNFIYANIDYLYKISNKCSLVFSYENRTNSDLLLIKEFSLKSIPNSVRQNGVIMTKFAPWINYEGIEKTSWIKDELFLNSINMKIKVNANKIDGQNEETLVFADNPNGLMGSSLTALEAMNGLDYSFISNVNTILIKKYSKSMIYSIVLTNFDDLVRIEKHHIEKIKSMGSSRMVIFDQSNLTKNSISINSYFHLSSIKKDIEIILYGKPWDQSLTYSNDYHRFDWMVSSSKYLDRIKSYNNNIYAIS